MLEMSIFPVATNSSHSFCWRKLGSKRY